MLWPMLLSYVLASFRHRCSACFGPCGIECTVASLHHRSIERAVIMRLCRWCATECVGAPYLLLRRRD